MRGRAEVQSIELINRKQNYLGYMRRRSIVAINRDPGIVLGRLQNDGLVGFDDWTMKPIRHKYKVKTAYY